MTTANRTRLFAVALTAVLGTASSTRVQAGRISPGSLASSTLPASTSACPAPPAASAASQPTPAGPCQCYPGGSAGPQHVIVLGQWSSDLEGCHAAANFCRQVISSQIQCDQGSRCNVNHYAPLSSCAYVTCNGQRCGYEIDCSVSWGCYYCD
jgi:hypothetical protein